MTAKQKCVGKEKRAREDLRLRILHSLKKALLRMRATSVRPSVRPPLFRRWCQSPARWRSFLSLSFFLIPWSMIPGIFYSDSSHERERTAKRASVTHACNTPTRRTSICIEAHTNLGLRRRFCCCSRLTAETHHHRVTPPLSRRVHYHHHHGQISPPHRCVSLSLCLWLLRVFDGRWKPNK